MRSLEIEFAPIARAKGLELTFVPCSLPVESDRSLLRRLLQNLISNAIKYTPRGRVLVGCRRHGQSLQIGVYDTGVGIPVTEARRDLQGVPPPGAGRADRARPRPRPVDRRAAGARAQPRHRDRRQRQRRLGVFGDGAGCHGDQPYRRRHQRDAAVQDADERRADRLHRERPGDPRRHEDAADGLGRRGDRGGRSGSRDRGDRSLRRQRDRACWSTIISTAATASPRSATSAAASARTFRRS